MKPIAALKNIFKPVDLTKGNIVKVILAFMFPIMLSNLFQLLYTFMDAAIVGLNCTSEEVAGVNACGSLVSFALQFAIGCTSGFSVIISARIGHHDVEGIKKSFFHQLVLLAIITVILTAAALALIDPLLKWEGLDPAKGENFALEYEAAKTYLTIIYAGIATTTFYNLIVAILRALGDSLTPFLFLLFSVALNTGLNCLFIITFHWGVAGAAASTILSQGIAVIGAFTYAEIKYDILRLKKSNLKLEWHESLAHLKLGLPLGFQFSILMIGIIVMQATIIAFDRTPSGDLVDLTPCQIGYGVACKIANFMMSPMESLGLACLSFAGQNSGCGDTERIKKGFKIGVCMELTIWVITATIGMLLTINGAYVRLLIAEESINQATIDYGNQYLYTVTPFMGILSLLFLGRNYLQGLQKPLWPFLAGIAELLARTIICLTLPYAVNGGIINNEANYWSYFFTCSADWMAWLVAATILMVASIKIIYFPSNKGKKKGDLDNNPQQIAA